MSEPLITPAAVYTFGGMVSAGTFLGMPAEAVALGACATAAVTAISEPGIKWLAVAYTIIGGLPGVRGLRGLPGENGALGAAALGLPKPQQYSPQTLSQKVKEKYAS